MNTFEQQYKDLLSDYRTWDQKEHADEWLLFPQNIGKRLSIDETSLSNGELYTILTNKGAKGRVGCVVAIIKGTDSNTVADVLRKIPVADRMAVEEVTRDMSASMEWITNQCFMNAVHITDRFHAQQLVSDALQDVRVALRWKAIERENDAIAQARKDDTEYQARLYENGDSEKQLLARGRYLLFKSSSNWTESQIIRAAILFREFPQIKKAYELSMLFRSFYEAKTKEEGEQKLQTWYAAVESHHADFPSFLTAAHSIRAHEGTILNYFFNRSTNASAESFNAKIKTFRGLVRGVTDKKFFLYRIAMIYG
ncbi:MAG: transposase [Candidatus Peribacteraceae bacterium]|nr:transposase [Candidatus Peribacteraceae bacterium]